MQIQKTNSHVVGSSGYVKSPQSTTRHNQGLAEHLQSSANGSQPKVIINQDLMGSQVLTPPLKTPMDPNQTYEYDKQAQFSFHDAHGAQNQQTPVPVPIMNLEYHGHPQTIQQTPESSLITQKESSGTLPQNDQSMQNLGDPTSGLEFRGNLNNTEQTSMIVQHGTDQSDSMQNLIVLGMTQNRTINVTTKGLGESEPYQQYNSNVHLLDGEL